MSSSSDISGAGARAGVAAQPPSPPGVGGGSARGGGGGGGDGAGACPATEPTLNLAGQVFHVRLIRALLQEIDLEGCVVLIVDEACNPGVGVPVAKSVGPMGRACTGVQIGAQ